MLFVIIMLLLTGRIVYDWMGSILRNPNPYLKILPTCPNFVYVFIKNTINVDSSTVFEFS